MSGNIYNQLAVANLPDGRLQLWSVDENLALLSRQQQTADPNSAWTPVSPFQTPEAKAVTFAAAPLSDGRLQLFVIDGSSPGQIWSTWQEATDPNSAWTSLSPFQTPEKGAYSVTAAPLSDGRLQLFVTDDSSPGKIWSTRQEATDPNSGWTPLSPLQTLQNAVRFLAVGSLSDRRLQLFLIDNADGQIWSTRQQTSDPDAAWLPPSPFQTPEAKAYLLAVGPLGGGRLQLFLIDNTWQIWSTQQQTTQHDAAWTPLSPLPAPDDVVRGSLAAAALSDGRVQFFLGDGFGQGHIWSTRRQTTDPNSAWMPFSQLS